MKKIILTSILLGITIYIISPASGCCDGTVWGDHCYKAFTNQYVTWADAQLNCMVWADGKGTLVSIQSAEENSFVSSLVGQVAWIGYTDAAVEGTWVWTMPPSDYKKWCSGEPNNYGGIENCAVINWCTGGGWNDLPCDYTKTPGYVCEKPMVPVP